MKGLRSRWQFLKLTKSLLRYHGLRNWRMQWFNDNAYYSNIYGGWTRTIGYCNYEWRALCFNRQYVALLSVEQQREVILHEISHALCTEEDEHNEKWMRVAQSIGAMPIAEMDFNEYGYPIVERNLAGK